ncbi:T9SS type A sorting domain-containing protein [Mariniflexile sp.]|uniref:T9SS type A sorting domain-containing protein n=1 Tax=Mariniflexile sp. TaxID=1979402 RepID=UPI004048E2EE
MKKNYDRLRIFDLIKTKQNKNKLLNFIFVWIFGLCFFGFQAQNMYVKETNDSQTTIPLASIKKITFQSGNIIVNSSSGINNSYALNELEYLNFYDSSLNVTEPSQVIKQVTVYPNPVSEVLNISISGYLPPIIKLEIISIDGRLVKKVNFNNNQPLLVNVSELNSGMYLCKISNFSTIETIKFIKH